MRKTLTTVIALTLLIINTSIFLPNTSAVENEDWILIDSSFRSSIGGLVYPGSRSAELTLITRYIGNGSATYPLACLNLPHDGFLVIDSKCTPARDPEDNILSNVSTGSIVYFRFGIDVSRDVEPGLYSVYINISHYNTIDNNLYWSVFDTVLEVSQYPSLKLVILDSYLSPYSYPGARYVYIVLGIRNIGETDIVYSRIKLVLPSELAEPSELNYTYTFTISPGREMYLDLGPVSINSNAQPGMSYAADLHVYAVLVTSDNIFYSDEENYTIELEISSADVVKLGVLTYELTSSINLPGLKNTGLRIFLQSLENGVTRVLYSRVIFENAVNINGSDTAIYMHEAVLNYLDTIWITYNGIVIYENVSYFRVNATIYGSVVRDNVEYPFTLDLWFTMPLFNREINVSVVKTWWDREIAYPGSVNNLIVSILNNETILSITEAVVELETSSGVIYPSRLVVYNILLSESSIVEVVFTNIVIPESIEPGVYEAVLRISGLLRCIDNSFKQIELVRSIPIIIVSYTSLEPVLPIFSLMDIYWGEVLPQYVYPGESRAPLTIVIQNTGILTATNTILVVNDIEPGDAELLTRSAVCSVQLFPGSACSATIYLDLTNSSSGLKHVNISVKYNLEEIGVSRLFIQQLVASIYLPDHPPGRGLALASYNWLNNYPAYTGARGAVLSVTLVNLEAYAINSVWLVLRTPIGIDIHSGLSSKIYVPGPVATLQTITVSFVLDLNTQPGIYLFSLDLDYFIQSNNGGVRKNQQHYFDLHVMDSSGSIDVVTYGWLVTPQPPPVYGAQLYVVIRNVEFPSITNPVLKLKLPDGVVESSTNSSEPSLLPVAGLNPQQLVLNQILSGSIVQLLTQYIQQSYTGSFSKGDFIVYVVSLNIERNYSVFNILYTLIFIDHWGEEYSVSSAVSVRYLTTPPLLSIYPKTPLIVFSNGTGFLDIVIENNYYAHVANLYLALVPVSGNAIPLNGFKYIEKLHSRTSIVIRIDLVYNPVQTRLGSIQVSSSSAVFTVVLMYNDITGIFRSINTTLAVMIKPFIELVLLPGATAKYSKGVLAVNGIIANIGVSSAKSTVVFLKYSGLETMSIIGDVDSSSQVPFRIELRTQFINETCTILVKYRDEYGAEYYLREELRVVQLLEELSMPSSSQQRLDVFKYIVIAIITIFLIGVFYVIYRHSRRLGRE